MPLPFGGTLITAAAQIADGIITNSHVSTSAAIAYSKLAALTDGNTLIGSAANVATSTAVTGDVTITNAGVTAIGSAVIVNADISASAAIVPSKFSSVFDNFGTATPSLFTDIISGSATITYSTTATLACSTGTSAFAEIIKDGDAGFGIYRIVARASASFIANTDGEFGLGAIVNGSVSTTTHNNLIWIQYLTDGTMRAINGSGGTTTATAAVQPADQTVDANWDIDFREGRVEYFRGGTSVATHTTNVPNDRKMNLHAKVGTATTAPTASRSLIITSFERRP